MRLTDLAIKNLAVERGQKVFFDDSLKGFGVRVSPRSKTFVLVIHRANRNKWETLGKYPVVSLAAARQEARDRLSAIQLRKGPDMPALRFGEAYELFLASYKAKNRDKTVYEMERIAKRHLSPKFDRTMLSDISTHELATIIERLMKRPGECLATFTAARTLFRWFARRRLIERSPLEGVPLPVKKVPRTRVLTDDELCTIWRACDDLDNVSNELATIVKLLILTGQRKGQIAKLRGEWVDRDQQSITWPPHAMKANRQHTLPLTTGAFSLVVKLRKEGFVFLARGKQTPFNGFSKCKSALDSRAGIAPWTLHDLRRTFATGIAKLRVPPHIKEMILAHATAKDPVEAIYDLYTYEPEMRDALQKWQEHVQALLSNAEGLHG